MPRFTVPKAGPVPAALTLAAATVGALLFAALGLPSPFMSGALVAVTVLALSGVRARVPEPLRQVCFLVLGASMGTAITPQMLQQAAHWPVSMGFLALSVAGVMAAVTLFLHKVAGWNLATAYYASAPGALSAVIALASASNADMRRVAFVQAVRLFLLVALLTQILGGGTHPPATSAAAAGLSPALDIAVLLFASLCGGLIATRLRIPGGMMMGALAVSALLHGTDWSHARVPDVVMVPAFIVLGAGVGARFRGTTMATLRDCLFASLGAFVVAMAVSLACALAAAWITGEDVGQMITAFAPGALETMAVLGYALGYDPAFMSAHHIFRFAGLSVALPLLAHLLFQARATDEE